MKCVEEKIIGFFMSLNAHFRLSHPGCGRGGGSKRELR